MMPTVTRAAMNRAEDIIREVGLVRVSHAVKNKGSGSAAAQCEGKKPFATFRAAEVVARKGHGISTYRCRFCHAWHVGGGVIKG